MNERDRILRPILEGPLRPDDHASLRTEIFREAAVGSLLWWIRRSVLCRRGVKSPELLLPGAPASRVIGAVKRFVSPAAHPDKSADYEKHLMANVNNAFDEVILELKFVGRLEWGVELMDQQVCYEMREPGTLHHDKLLLAPWGCFKSSWQLGWDQRR